MLNQILRYLKLTILSRLGRYPLTTGKMEPAPVFILSAGRSGSTLLRKILLRTGYISIPPESHYLIPKLTFLFIKHSYRPWDELVEILLKDIETKSYFNYWKLTVTKEDVVYLKNNLPHSLDAFLHFFYHKYTTIHHPQAIIWGDKTPLLTYHTDIIDQIYPSAKYIVLTRDGRDVIASFIENDIYTDISYLSRRWIKSLAVRDSLLKTKGNGLVHSVHYEDLVCQPLEEVAKICQFLAIPFHPVYIEDTHVYLGDDQQKHFNSTKSGIDASHIGKWKTTLSIQQKNEIEKAISKELKKNNYLL